MRFQNMPKTHRSTHHTVGIYVLNVPSTRHENVEAK